MNDNTALLAIGGIAAAAIVATGLRGSNSASSLDAADVIGGSSGSTRSVSELVEEHVERATQRVTESTGGSGSSESNAIKRIRGVVETTPDDTLQQHIGSSDSPQEAIRKILQDHHFDEEFVSDDSNTGSGGGPGYVGVI